MNKTSPQTHKKQVSQQQKIHGIFKIKRRLNRIAISRKEPSLRRLHEYLWKSIKCANDEPDDNGSSDSFYMQSTILPKRFICIYQIAEAPMALLLEKKQLRDGTFSQNRAHDRLFAGFQIVHQASMAQVVKTWMQGKPMEEVQKCIISKQNDFYDLEFH